MNTRCRFCGSDKGVYVENKAPSKRGWIVAAMLWTVAVLGSIMFIIFIPIGFLLLLAGLACLLLIKDPQIFCAICQGRLR